MHVRVDGSDIACDPRVPVNRTRTTQNARSAIMGESSAADVGLSTQGRMVLVALLAFTYFFSACQAKLSTAYPPVYLPESLGGMIHKDGLRHTEYVVPLPFSGKAQLDDEDGRPYSDARSKHDFVLAQIRARKLTNDRVDLDKEKAVGKYGNKQVDVGIESSLVKHRSKRKSAVEDEENLLNFPNIEQLSDRPSVHNSHTENGDESISEDANRVGYKNDRSSRRGGSAQNIELPRPNLNQDFSSPDDVYPSNEGQLKLEIDPSTLRSSSYDSNFIQQSNQPLSDNTYPSDNSKNEKYTKHDVTELSRESRSKSVNDSSFLHFNAIPDLPHPPESTDTTPKNPHPNSGDLNELHSLIHDTVRRMEMRLEQIHNRHHTLSEASTKASTADAKDMVDENLDKYTNPTILAWKDTPDFHMFGVDDEDVEEINDNDFSPLELREYEDHATAVILHAIETQTIPEDFEFWKNVSKFLDHDYNYLSRTKRRAGARRWKSRRRFSPRRHAYQQLRHRLSITYSHVVPCASRDRFYCMNGGTCVFVDALDIKTCRCPIGYTGVRCQMIDQEYILHILTKSFVITSN